MMPTTTTNETRTAAPEDSSKYPASDRKSLRQEAGALRLLLSTIGGPRQWAGKSLRIARTVATFANRAEIRRRLERLHSLGLIEEIPTALQLTFGGLDMLRYFIEPGARDYYESRGINFAFHQVLRILDDPVSMIDPIGILSERDTIIGHLLQVTHANPVYDLQLLSMFDDGLDQLESQTRQVIDGTHPRAKSIGAIVEDPEYHGRLLEYVRRFRRDPATPEMRRRALHARDNRHFVMAEETFGTLPGAMRYMARLPKTLPELWRHYRENEVIHPRYCDPEVVEYVASRFD